MPFCRSAQYAAISSGSGFTHCAAAPLKQADDAVLLDTSELNFEQSFEAMKKIITEKVG